MGNKKKVALAGLVVGGLLIFFLTRQAEAVPEEEDGELSLTDVIIE